MSMKYILIDADSIRLLINKINGNINTSKILSQFDLVCSALDITPLEPFTFSKDNALFSGLFDAHLLLEILQKIEEIV